MTNRVKYAKTRKYRDVGFNEPIEKEQRTRTRTSFNIKKKKNIFQIIKDKLKLIFK